MTVSSDLKPMLIIPDVHRPYHDKRAWDLVLGIGAKIKPQVVVSIGDFMDFYAVSSHSKDPSRARQLDEELQDGHQGLDELEQLDAEDYHYIAGNHEDRLTRYLQDKAPELFTVIDIPKLLRLDERGWQYTPYKAFTQVGRVHYTHDVGAAGRNATFKALDTFQHSVITGHTHRMQYIVEGNAIGEHKLSAQFGWLGDRSKVDYMQQVNVNKNWALGFGVGYLEPASGINYLVPVPIIPVSKRYTAMVNGKLYTN